jgi:hypothetical protein
MISRRPNTTFGWHSLSGGQLYFNCCGGLGLNVGLGDSAYIYILLSWRVLSDQQEPTKI